MLRIIHFVQNLSLDITVGAMISCWFIGDFLQLDMPPSVIIGLGIAIWLIYTADHLLDARKASNTIVNPRHDFHRRYEKQVIILAIVIFCVGLYNAFHLPLNTIYYGVVLIGLSGLYFLYLRYSKAQTYKEILAALVYTAGLFTGPMSLISGTNTAIMGLALHFFLLAFANLLILPMFEIDMDEQQGVNSIATRKGDKSVQLMARIVLVFGFLLIIAQVYWNSSFVTIAPLFLIMYCSLLALLLRPKLFQNYQLYRLVGDGVFFLPALALL